MSSPSSFIGGINPIAQAAAAGIQLGQHAITEYAAVQKHRAENPSPSAGPAKSKHFSATLGIYNKIEQKTDVLIIKKEDIGPGRSFVNGAAWGVGAAVALGVGAWVWGKLVSGDQEKTAIVLFKDQEHYDDD